MQAQLEALPRMDPRTTFRMCERIGKGSFGAVYRVEELSTNRTLAAKIIDLEEAEDGMDDIHQEINVLSSSRCPQLTQYYGSYVVDSKLWILMEYLEGGSLANIIKESGTLDEPTIAYVLKELLLALAYLHGQRKIHRDVKAGNILVAADGTVKLSDFGVTGQLTDSICKRKTFVGTPFWMAPEVIMESSYDSSADIWSVGITAIELAKGEPPYASVMHPMRVVFHIPKNPPPTLDGDFSNKFKDFVSTCLKKDPSLRPTAVELARHTYIKNSVRTDLLPRLITQRRSRRPRETVPITMADRILSRGLSTNSPSNPAGVSPHTDESGWDFKTFNSRYSFPNGLNPNFFPPETADHSQSADQANGLPASSGSCSVSSPGFVADSMDGAQTPRVHSADSQRRAFTNEEFIPSPLFANVVQPSVAALQVKAQELYGDQPRVIRAVKECVAALKRLDEVVNGELTGELVTTMTSYMMEELGLGDA